MITFTLLQSWYKLEQKHQIWRGGWKFTPCPQKKRDPEDCAPKGKLYTEACTIKQVNKAA